MRWLRPAQIPNRLGPGLRRVRQFSSERSRHGQPHSDGPREKGRGHTNSGGGPAYKMAGVDHKRMGVEKKG